MILAASGWFFVLTEDIRVHSRHKKAAPSLPESKIQPLTSKSLYPAKQKRQCLLDSFLKEHGPSGSLQVKNEWNVFSIKEVIQPQVPLRLPCYDFTPIIGPTVDCCLLAVSSQVSGKTNFRGVTGGVYKARERIHPGMLIQDY